MTEEYEGPATVRVDGSDRAVRLRLAGRFEPVDGRFHWGGRIEPDAGLADVGLLDVTVRIGDRPSVPARLGDVDPWGGRRIVGIGQPPWPADFTLEVSP